MEFFLDTANTEEIRQAARWGVITGVTTNPSLAAKEGIGDFGSYRDAVLEIASIIDGPISVEVVSQDVEGMTLEGKDIATWMPQAVVKIPSTPAGFSTISALAREGIKVNQTLCFSVNQALLGARAGSHFISPFVGRLDDAGHDGMAIVADMVEAMRRYGYGVRIMAASIRYPLHCVAAAKAGVDVATIPFKVLTQMMQHPLTDAGVAKFAQDWKSTVKV